LHFENLNDATKIVRLVCRVIFSTTAIWVVRQLSWRDSDEIEQNETKETGYPNLKTRMKRNAAMGSSSLINLTEHASSNAAVGSKNKQEQIRTTSRLAAGSFSIPGADSIPFEPLLTSMGHGRRRPLDEPQEMTPDLFQSPTAHDGI
jgi:hypothetical protein